MPLHINDLQLGDRVVLNCGASRVMAKREAQFEGIFQTIGEAMSRDSRDGILLPGASAEFLAGGAFARFLFQAGPTDLVGAFRIEPDGALREEEGRRITIEMRVRMGQG
jgi:hypothetical protein